MDFSLFFPFRFYFACVRFGTFILTFRSGREKFETWGRGQGQFNHNSDERTHETKGTRKARHFRINQVKNVYPLWSIAMHIRWGILAWNAISMNRQRERGKKPWPFVGDFADGCLRTVCIWQGTQRLSFSIRTFRCQGVYWINCISMEYCKRMRCDARQIIFDLSSIIVYCAIQPSSVNKSIWIFILASFRDISFAFDIFAVFLRGTTFLHLMKWKIFCVIMLFYL